MTSNPTDVRRAATLILHVTRDDPAGVRLVIDEVNASPSPATATFSLLMTVVGLLAPGDADTTAMLEGVALTMASLEQDQPEETP